MCDSNNIIRYIIMIDNLMVCCTEATTRTRVESRTHFWAQHRRRPIHDVSTRTVSSSEEVVRTSLDCSTGGGGREEGVGVRARLEARWCDHGGGEVTSGEKELGRKERVAHLDRVSGKR
jgi:hypothetical protein